MATAGQAFEQVLEKLRISPEFAALERAAIAAAAGQPETAAAAQTADSDTLLLDWLVGEYLRGRGCPAAAAVLASEAPGARAGVLDRVSSAALLGFPLATAAGTHPMLYSVLAVAQRAGLAFQGASLPQAVAPPAAVDENEANALQSTPSTTASTAVDRALLQSAPVPPKTAVDAVEPTEPSYVATVRRIMEENTDISANS